MLADPGRVDLRLADRAMVDLAEQGYGPIFAASENVEDGAAQGVAPAEAVRWAEGELKKIYEA